MIQMEIVTSQKVIIDYLEQIQYKVNNITKQPKGNFTSSIYKLNNNNYKKNYHQNKKLPYNKSNKRNEDIYNFEKKNFNYTKTKYQNESFEETKIKLEVEEKLAKLNINAKEFIPKKFYGNNVKLILIQIEK